MINKIDLNNVRFISNRVYRIVHKIDFFIEHSKSLFSVFCVFYEFKRILLNLKAFVITETELKHIANAATIGDNKIPDV